MKQSEIFSTERLQIRRIHQGDALRYFEIFGASDVAEFDDFEPISKEEAIEDVQRIIENEHDPEKLEFELAVSEKGESALLGVLYYKLELDILFIGYHFHGDARGKGFAREAVAGLVNYLKSSYSNPIKAKVDSENSRSIHLLEQLGFLRDASYEIPQFFKGKNHMEWCYFLP